MFVHLKTVDCLETILRHPRRNLGRSTPVESRVLTACVAWPFCWFSHSTPAYDAGISFSFGHFRGQWGIGRKHFLPAEWLSHLFPQRTRIPEDSRIQLEAILHPPCAANLPVFLLLRACDSGVGAPGVDHGTDRTIISAATFTLNYHHLWDPWPVGLDYPVIGHYWTLALEEQFYLLWPLLMLLFVRRKLVAFLNGFIVIAPLVRIVSYFLMPGSRSHIGMMFHTAFDSIAAGVLLGELLRTPETRAKLQRFAANRWILATAIVYPALVSPLLSLHFGGAYSITHWQES